MTFSNLLHNLQLFDSHCHLNDSAFDADRDGVVKRAKESGVEAIIDIGVDVKSSQKAIRNSEKYETVYAAVGVDAENLIPGSDLFQKDLFRLSDDEFDEKLNQIKRGLEKLAGHEKVIMIGETGMDNYWLVKRANSGSLSEKNQLTSLQRQEKMFRIHCEIALETSKPLSIHSRNAIDRCLRIVEEEKILEQMAVFHSLTADLGDDEEKFYKKVKKILERGHLIGVNGIITFKNADLIRNVYNRFFDLNAIDLEKMYKAGFVFETDAPFLSPEPKRGECNEPRNLKYILKNA